MTTKWNGKETLDLIKKLIYVAVGTLSIALGTAIFLVPFNLVAGGMSGIAIVVTKLANVEFLTVDMVITILTWVTFFLGLLLLGKSFALKTLVSTILYPISFKVCSSLTAPDVLGGYFNLTSSENQQIALLISAVVGGVLVGLGCALAFLGGGSTGGTDIIALLVCKVFPRIKSSQAVLLVDSLVVISGLFVVKDFLVSMLGIFSIMVMSVMIDRVFLGSSTAFVAEIVTSNHEPITKAVINEMDRTTTVVDGVGGFSGRAKKLVKVSFTMREYSELIRIVNRYDSRAFVTVYKAHEVSGHGFSKEKHYGDDNTPSLEETNPSD